MKIGIFGGSFDPIHKGHVEIAKQAIKFLNLDKLIFVPANINPFKNKKPVSSMHRLNMLKIALSNFDNVEISDFEIKKQFKSYTIETVKHFKNIYKTDEIFLLIGSDNVAKLNDWKNIDEIASLVKIVVFKRNNYVSHINIKKFNCLLLNNQISNFSSTEYKNGNLEYVDEKVQDYIGQNFLYFDDIARNTLSHSRYAHLKNCADFAVKLAKYLLPNDKLFHKQAYEAGYMHDITKEWNETKSYEFLKKYVNDIYAIYPYQLHQNTAYYFLLDLYKYPHKNVLNAIKIHTSLDNDLTLLDKILFVADKICEGRKFEGVQGIRKLVFQNFDEGFAKVVKICAIDYNLNKNVVFTKEQEKIYRKWSKINKIIY